MNEYINPNLKSKRKKAINRGRRKEIPNSKQRHKIISFRACSLSPIVIQHLEGLSKINKKNKFINDAINSYYFYIQNPKGYFKQMIELNFGLIRHILRKVGRK